jgi:hypothetical protein
MKQHITQQLIEQKTHTYSPNINQRSKRIKSKERVEERLNKIGASKAKRINQIKKKLDEGNYKTIMSPNSIRILEKGQYKLSKVNNGSTENLDFFYVQSQPFVIELNDSEVEDINRPSTLSSDSGSKEHLRDSNEYNK